MKRIVAILALVSLLHLGAADSNGTNATDAANESPGGLQLPEVNTSELADRAKNATKTGVGPIDQAMDFLADASPFLLLIIGILLIVLAGFGKIIGIILIILALIRLIWMMFF